MLKKITKVLLICILLAAFVVIYYLKSASNSIQTDYFNRHIRPSIASIYPLRLLLALHNVGDGRADYLGVRYSKIFVQVDAMDNVSLDNAMLGKLQDRIAAVTGKPTTVSAVNTHILYSSPLNEDKIASYVNYYKKNQSTSDTALLYVLFASQKQGDPQLLAETYQEYGIIVFDQALNADLQLFPQYFHDFELLAILNQFGHQLGLLDNNQPGCVMNIQFERSGGNKSPSQLVDDYCSAEKNQIEQNK